MFSLILQLSLLSMMFFYTPAASTQAFSREGQMTERPRRAIINGIGLKREAVVHVTQTCGVIV